MMKGFLIYLAKRYIAGSEAEHAIEVVRRLNADGILATIDNLGENVTTAEEAESSVAEYHRLLTAIDGAGVNSTISLKLTHLGLDISEELAYKNTAMIVEKAGELSNFVRIDMESSAYTEKTLDIFYKLRQRHENVGIAIQSYLLRSAKDIETLIEKEASVRLVKGAYKEPAAVALQKKSDVDENYSRLMRRLLTDGVNPAIATHDEKLIDEAIEFSKGRNIANERFEFQMLLGIRRTLQKELAGKGYRVRVYVPYGKNWLPYITRRMSERKENLFFVLRHIVD